MKMARERGPGEKMPTVRTICATFGVSTSTLDPVLSELEVQGIITRLHGSGIFVAATVHQKKIAVVFGDDIFATIFSPFWISLLRETRAQAFVRSSLGIKLYMDISQGHDGLRGRQDLISDLEAQRLQGILLLAPKSDRDEVAELSGFGVPLVTMSRSKASKGWTIGLDRAPVFSLATRELVARGCQRIALLGQVTEADNETFRGALKVSGYTGAEVEEWSPFRWPEQWKGLFSLELFAAWLAKRKIEARGLVPFPDGLVSLDDTMTRGVISEIHQAGLQIGRDIHIVTTVNKGSPVLELYANQLLQIEYDPACIVKGALDMLENLMNGVTPCDNPVLIAPSLQRPITATV